MSLPTYGSEMLINTQSSTLPLTALMSTSPNCALPSRQVLPVDFFRVDKDLNVIKGGGACHLREKVLAEAAETFVSPLMPGDSSA